MKITGTVQGVQTTLDLTSEQFAIFHLWFVSKTARDIVLNALARAGLLTVDNEIGAAATRMAQLAEDLMWSSNGGPFTTAWDMAADWKVA